MNCLECLCIFNTNKKYVWNKALLKNHSPKKVEYVQPLAVKWIIQSQRNVWVKIIKSKMTYSESESDFSFAINSALDLDSASESESRHLYFLYPIFAFFKINLRMVFFISSHNRINSYASNSSIMHIFVLHSITQKVCFYHPSNSLTLAFKYFCS